MPGTTTAVHVFCFQGFAGSGGKSTISLEIARIFAGSCRLLASYEFFFRDAGDRSRMNRFAATLAAQMASRCDSCHRLTKKALEFYDNVAGSGPPITTSAT
jgi:hypothetical protein